MKQRAEILKKRLKYALSSDDPNEVKTVAEGGLWSASQQLTTPFNQLFVKQMGGGDFAIGLVNSLPALFALVTLLPFSAYIDTLPRRKPFTAKMVGLYGLLLLFMAIAPFLGDIKVAYFVLFVALFNVPMLAYTVAWQSFFTEIFPKERRIIPYANRETVRYFVQSFVMVAGGFILSYVAKGDGGKIIAYQMFFIAAFVFAMIQRKVLLSTDDSAVKDTGKKPFNLFESFSLCVKEMGKNSEFSLFLALWFIFSFACQLTSPLFFIYVVEYAGANEFFKTVLDVVGIIILAFTAKGWGRYIQKKGSMKAGVIGCFTAAVSPGLLVFWNSSFGIFMNYVISGTFSAPLNMGTFNDMLECLPEENRTVSIGIYNTVTQITMFIAPILGVAMYRKFGIENAMYIGTVLRMAGSVLFLMRYLKRKNKPLLKSE